MPFPGPSSDTSGFRLQHCFPALPLVSSLSRALCGERAVGRSSSRRRVRTPLPKGNQTRSTHFSEGCGKAHRLDQVTGGFSKVALEGITWYGKMRHILVWSLILTQGSSVAEPKAGPTTFFLVALEGFTTSFSRGTLLSFITSLTL